jgi:hypothetical protein
MSVEVAQLLYRHDPDNEPRHLGAVRRAEARRQRSALDELLLPLRREDSFFEILWHYVRTLSYWSLTIELEVPIGDIVEPDGARRAAALQRWAGGGTSDAVLTDDGQRTVIDGDFLIAGFALYHSDALSGKEHDGGRRAVDRLAGDMLDAYLTTLTQRGSGLPQEVRTVLSDHVTALDIPAVVRL